MDNIFKSSVFGIETKFRSSVMGIGEIPREDWKRKDWARLYKDLYLNNSVQDANDRIWQEWIKPTNKYSKYFSDPVNLIINLASYRKVDQVGQIFYITWESQPVYATWDNWFNDVEYWRLPQWKIWYKEIKQHYGKTEAQKMFQNAWSYSDNSSIGINEDGMYYEGGYDCDFINFFRHEGLDVALFGAENLCTLVNTGSNLIDATENVSEAIETTTGFAANVMPYLLMTAAALTIYSQVKKINK